MTIRFCRKDNLSCNVVCGYACLLLGIIHSANVVKQTYSCPEGFEATAELTLYNSTTDAYLKLEALSSDSISQYFNRLKI